VERCLCAPTGGGILMALGRFVAAQRRHPPARVGRASAADPGAGVAGGRRPSSPQPMTPGDVAASAQPRGPLRLLLDPVFGPFMAGKMLSTAGIWVFNIAAAIL